ncbi:unnamed protein product, partial [Allacma fusca]
MKIVPIIANAIQNSKKKTLQESTLADIEKSISAYIVH